MEAIRASAAIISENPEHMPIDLEFKNVVISRPSDFSVEFISTALLKLTYLVSTMTREIPVVIFCPPLLKLAFAKASF